MNVDLTTLTALRRRVVQANLASTDTADDDLLKQIITEASGVFKAETGRTFMPIREVKEFDSYDPTGFEIDLYNLYFNSEDLLEIHEFCNGDGTEITSLQYRMRPNNIWPKDQVRITQASGVMFSIGSDQDALISIDGTWGYHDDYPHAWDLSYEVLPVGGITSSASSWVATDPYSTLTKTGRQRIEVGAYLKLDDEVVKVLDITQTSGPTVYTVHVSRGELGTTAVSHDAATIVYSYNQIPDIELQCLRLCQWLYENKDTTSGQVRFLDTNVVLEDNTLADIFNRIAAYKRTDYRPI